MSAAPKDIHQAVLFDIAFEIQTLLKKTKIGKIRIAPYDVRFSNQNILQPDLLFIKTENMHRIKEKGLVGAPDLVIEVLSPATTQLDFEEKKLVYEKYGVSEYFIIDPASSVVDYFYLVNGIYEMQERVKGKIVSNVLSTEIVF